jgi:hypothetical protein
MRTYPRSPQPSDKKSAEKKRLRPLCSPFLRGTAGGSGGYNHFLMDDVRERDRTPSLANHSTKLRQTRSWRRGVNPQSLHLRR